VGSSAAQGVGVTPHAVYLGVPYSTNTDAANAALGAGGLTTGDTRADYEAAIADVNAHGGVAGRRLVPVFHASDAQSQEPKASQDQAACADFTQDHHVAGVASVGLTNTFTQCVLAAGAIEVDSSVIIDPDKAMFRQFPYYFEAGTLSQDRMMAAYVGALVHTHYFTGWNATAGRPASGKPVIGVIGVDVPEWNRPLDHVFLPALRAAGYPVASKDIARIHNPESVAEDSSTLTQIQNAVLRFRSDGVTHVIMLDSGGSFLTFFGKDAKSQHYYPRFGVDSGSAVQTIFDAGLVDADQLRGASGLGWNPSLDLSLTAAAKYRTSTSQHCLKVVRQRTGQTLSSADEQAVALGACDEVYLFARAVNDAGSVINHDTLRAAIERLHSAYKPAGLPAAYFDPGRHDAAELGFDLAWNPSCTCATYARQYRIPS
jgi:ABC-type branched-subunit amino acid transport system substrate-binding protein